MGSEALPAAEAAEPLSVVAVAAEEQHRPGEGCRGVRVGASKVGKWLGLRIERVLGGKFVFIQEDQASNRLF